MMMTGFRIAWLVSILLALHAFPPSVTAQSTHGRDAFQHVVEMRVRVAHAPIYVAPRRNADVVRTLAWNERLLVLRQDGSFYHVVDPAEGLQGYVISAQLRASDRPLPEADMPDAVRRERTHIGTRFDVEAGIAVPYGASTFADRFDPGTSIDARLSHPLGGPLGVTARISYRQFGRSGSQVARPLSDRVNLHGRDVSLLAGAIGLDLTAFRGHGVAIVITADGGAYHALVDDESASTHPFSAGSSFAWGGSASARLSVRLGGPVRLFAEPGYEVVWMDQGTLRLLPLRVGLSLER